ncbi:MAG: class I adenylate cyclase [Desulfobacterales bacterium]|nr:class I adenylate cyclase [Desulfobacterales bacterium]
MKAEPTVKYNLSEKVKNQIFENRTSFSHYNIVRMREAIRYLSKDKLKLFTQIPFLLHINLPEFPGFIDSLETAHGIWNFEHSGFYKEALKTGFLSKNTMLRCNIDEPSIQGFYHIGSLGTFTQSASSDFDYWVIINKKLFSEERYYVLEKKLAQIVKFSMEEYNQKVTFFIMDQEDIKNNCYAEFKGEETLIAPKIFLKEEFYRTFLMIAGKIPYWSILPSKLDELTTYQSLIKTISTHKSFQSICNNFIDLGDIESTTFEDVIKGLLWHICKSKLDPVKALIKSSMIFSYVFDSKENQSLLCNNIKNNYSKTGIDDYNVDPYKILFDRIISFYEKIDLNGLNLIKNAIFFRLCGYPNVSIPEIGSPKKKLFDRYIREWNLKESQVSKLLSFTSWSESEKLLIEQVLINQLVEMYSTAMKELEKKGIKIDQSKEKRNWTILKNKTKERLNKSPNKIPECSTYIKQKIMETICIKNRSMVSWYIPSQPSKKKSPLLYSNSHLLGILGWIIENQLYNRYSSSIVLKTDLKLFESSKDQIDIDKIYLVLQPLKPLSDNEFETKPVWKKIVVLLIFKNFEGLNMLKKAEILTSNTWGELFLEVLEFDMNTTIKSKCEKIALKIITYSASDLKILFFQLASEYDPDVVYMIKKGYDGLNAKPSVNQLNTGKKRPYLDIL